MFADIAGHQSFIRTRFGVHGITILFVFLVLSLFLFLRLYVLIWVLFLIKHRGGPAELLVFKQQINLNLFLRYYKL